MRSIAHLNLGAHLLWNMDTDSADGIWAEQEDDTEETDNEKMKEQPKSLHKS